MNTRSCNVAWRLDYFQVSLDLAPAVREVVIHDDVRGSDHCQVRLELDL
jgi:exodeoxyribonuclease III